LQAAEDHIRRAFRLLRNLVLEGPPAEEAALVAPKGRRQLDAAVAFNTVKLVLVAHLPAGKRSLAPEAGLKGC